ncbi:nicotinamide mononucleotide adenylyltransferase-like isoform X1 [Tripterygium wilfordii]|uniref:Nicotinamide mononucleotide adenylyltransferase-like isoform X1 n=1 Tax=Tripterygium wilfordii TaxID=458696 RepID=A0A7J7C195_TRIWF|nr:nicotinamide mononucleotide adenylyltransferase-like isoform X1 [Tripterygium wilfordii]
MVDTWEAKQNAYQRTLTVLSRVKDFLVEHGLVSRVICRFFLQHNIKVVDELVPNLISSTRMRECISRGLSIKYLTADKVIDYIKDYHLYLSSDDKESLNCNGSM